MCVLLLTWSPSLFQITYFGGTGHKQQWNKPAWQEAELSTTGRLRIGWSELESELEIRLSDSSWAYNLGQQCNWNSLRNPEAWQPRFLTFRNCMFIYLGLCWVFVTVWAFFWLLWAGASLSLCCRGCSFWWLLLLCGMDCRVPGLRELRFLGCRADSVFVLQGSSCPTEFRIFPDQGSNPCLLHWQADS